MGNLYSQTLPITGIEDLEEAVVGSEVEPIQLSSGPFTGRLVSAQLHEGTLSAGSFDGRVVAKGPLSKSDLTIGALTRSEGPSSQWSFETRPGDIAVIPPSVEHVGRYAGQTSWVTISLPLEKMLELAHHVRPHISDSFWNRAAMYRPQPYKAAQINNLFRIAINTIADRPETIQHSNARRVLFEELLLTYLSCLEEVDPAPLPTRLTFVSSTHIMNLVDDYISNKHDQPVSLSELCQGLNISRRSLHRAFTDALDTSPGVYLRQRRLSLVRRALIATQSPWLKVSDVAGFYGFWELGRFAQQYRQHFGELPSETLKTAIAKL